MKYGVAWYPEAWPEARWAADLAAFGAAKFNLVRIAEYAWPRLEPEDGTFDFGWLDRAMAMLEEGGFAVVLGTPTARPPAWLIRDHPDALVADLSGVPKRRGAFAWGRPGSATYRKYGERALVEVARRYGRRPGVIGWQIDNEYNRSRISLDPDTVAQFHAWLVKAYGSLDVFLHPEQGFIFPRSIRGPEDLPPPPDFGGWTDLAIAWKKFTGHLFASYQRGQIGIIRAHADPRQWTTTNAIAWQALFDHADVTRDLDFVSWDSYWPTYTFPPAATPDPAMEALGHDYHRGMKRKNFWLLETQFPSVADWAAVNVRLDPGVVRLRGWQAVAHGCDGILYWQARMALAGGGELHGSLLGADGTPRPGIEEVAKLGSELATAADALAGTTPRADVALLHSFESRWAVELQPVHKAFDYVLLLRDHHAPFVRRSLMADVVPPVAPLGAYKLVIAPGLWLMADASAAALREYAEGGGHLVLGVRTAARDEHNATRETRPPGPLAGPAGVEVEEVYPLMDPVGVKAAGRRSLRGRASIWAERLAVRADDVRVLARFAPDAGWLAGRPAVTTRKVGRGRISVLAGWFDPELLDAACAELIRLSGFPARRVYPVGVEVARRFAPDGRAVVIAMNHGPKPAKIPALPGRPLFAKRSKGKWTLAPRDVEVFV